jgi:hypothetical protein
MNSELGFRANGDFLDFFTLRAVKVARRRGKFYVF